LYYTFYSIALVESAMERVPLHSWEMEFSIQYHVTLNSQLNDQNSIRYYIINYINFYSENLNTRKSTNLLVGLFKKWTALIKEHWRSHGDINEVQELDKFTINLRINFALYD
jgi:hypothetical protein